MCRPSSSEIAATASAKLKIESALLFAVSGAQTGSGTFWWQGSKNGRRSTAPRENRPHSMPQSRNVSKNKRGVTDSSTRMVRGLAEHCEPPTDICNVKAKPNTTSSASRRNWTGVSGRRGQGSVSIISVNPFEEQHKKKQCGKKNNKK